MGLRIPAIFVNVIFCMKSDLRCCVHVISSCVCRSDVLGEDNQTHRPIFKQHISPYSSFFPPLSICEQIGGIELGSLGTELDPESLESFPYLESLPYLVFIRFWETTNTDEAARERRRSGFGEKEAEGMRMTLERGF